MCYDGTYHEEILFSLGFALENDRVILVNIGYFDVNWERTAEEKQDQDMGWQLHLFILIQYLYVDLREIYNDKY